MDEEELVKIFAKIDWRKVPKDFRLLIVFDRVTIRLRDEDVLLR